MSLSVKIKTNPILIIMSRVTNRTINVFAISLIYKSYFCSLDIFSGHQVCRKKLIMDLFQRDTLEIMNELVEIKEVTLVQTTRYNLLLF